MCKPVAVSSNLTAFNGEEDLQKICLTYIQCTMIASFKSRSRITSKNYQALIRKVWMQKLNHTGGSLDVYVNQRVKLPQEFILAGTSKDRVNYNQLNITQWTPSFC